MKNFEPFSVIILFGEMGAGKNYWGSYLSKLNDMPFFDGDDVITPEMAERVSKFQALTPEIIGAYIEDLIYDISYRATEKGLIVAQALYSDDNRKLIYSLLTQQGFNVQFYWIKTSFWRNLKQLFSRPRGLRWIVYWLMNKPYFEKPTHDYMVIC